MAEPTRVVVAEDVGVVVEIIVEVLEQAGYEVVGTAADGEQAVAAVQELRPDVVVMDLEMPRMDGVEATLEIMERCPTPVVALTSHESKEWLERASKAGICAYLGKPVSRQDAEQAITIAMARFADIMQLRRLNQQLESALAEVKTLSGLLPICASCKKVRHDSGYWEQIESYIGQRSNAEFSHGLCPDCAKELFDELQQEPEGEGE